MKRLIVHVGMPKTGSTTIQTMLRNCTEPLTANGVHVPTLSGKEHGKLARELVAAPHNPRLAWTHVYAAAGEDPRREQVLDRRGAGLRNADMRQQRALHQAVRLCALNTTARAVTAGSRLPGFCRVRSGVIVRVGLGELRVHIAKVLHQLFLHRLGPFLMSLGKILGLVKV